MSKRSPAELAKIASLIAGIAREYGVDPQTLVRVAVKESRLDSNALNKKSGAAGAFQILPRIAKKLGIDPTDIEASARYVAGMMKKSGKKGYDFYAQHNQGGLGSHIINEWRNGKHGTFVGLGGKNKHLNGKNIGPKQTAKIVRNILKQPIMKKMVEDGLYTYDGDNNRLARIFHSAQGQSWGKTKTYLPEPTETERMIDEEVPQAVRTMANKAAASVAKPTEPVEHIPQPKAEKAKLDAVFGEDDVDIMDMM